MIVNELKIEKQIGSGKIVLYPSLILTGNKSYLVDCGYEETFDELCSALQNVGVNINELTGVIISHDDIDHLGALKKIKDKNEKLRIFSSAIERSSICGHIKSERLIQAENSLNAALDKTDALNFIERLRNIQRVDVDKTFEDGETFENDIKIIHTPGHTTGHLSFFCEQESTVIAGDALIVVGNEFEIANPEFTVDLPRALKSVKIIQDLNPKKIICYHGGAVSDRIKEKLESLISRYELTDHF